jgi:hypothetical protein
VVPQNDARFEWQMELRGPAPFHRQGGVPRPNLIFDRDYEHLYGTTVEGGGVRYGVEFELLP